MAELNAVITEDARKYWPQFFGGLRGISAGATIEGQWNPIIKYFRVGEGGWLNPGSGAVPRTPDPTLRRQAPVSDWDDNPYYLQDLDAICDLDRTTNQRYTNRGWYQKELTTDDFFYDGTLYGVTSLQVRCALDTGEANGLSLWEIALYSPHPMVAASEHVPLQDPPSDSLLMVAYGTFPLISKDSSKRMEQFVRLVF